MKIADICHREVHLIRAEQPLVEAARLMERRHIGALVVVDGQAPVRPIGMLTDRDIACGQLVHKADLQCLTVGEVMSRDPLTVPESAGLTEAIAALRERAVRRAPVVNQAGELVGIVTLEDLLPVIAGELRTLARLLAGQARLEAARL